MYSTFLTIILPPLPCQAGRLLRTKPPKDEVLLMTAASQLMATGKLDGKIVDAIIPDRPATRQRANGRIAMTVLNPHLDVVTNKMGGMGSTTPMAPPMDGQEDNDGVEDDETEMLKKDAVSLKVGAAEGEGNWRE
jgi:hypothetical protein